MPTVLICGASSDIGIETCRRYLSAGWRVIAHLRTPRDEINSLIGPQLETWRVDFADMRGFEQELRDKRERLVEADAFINLAAAFPACSFEAATVDGMLSAFAVNLVPGLLIMQLLGPAMVRRGWGRIVHASSIGVKFGGGSDSFLYSLSKHAQEFIPRACRQWAERNVFVNVLRIGVTDTRFHRRQPGKDFNARVQLIPTGRAATPNEIAEALFWFGSESNGFTTGQVISVAGGE